VYDWDPVGEAGAMYDNELSYDGVLEKLEPLVDCFWAGYCDDDPPGVLP
jgi:hypothetical protein